MSAFTEGYASAERSVSEEPLCSHSGTAERPVMLYSLPVCVRVRVCVCVCACVSVCVCVPGH